MSDLSRTEFDPTPNAHLSVVVVNEMDRTFSFEYGRVRYEFPPGVPVWVPYLAMCHAFGNPALQDMSTTNPDQRYRVKEVARLSARYGTETNPWYTDHAFTTTPTFKEERDTPHTYLERLLAGRHLYMHPNLPRVKLYTHDQKRIVSVIDDPTGELAFGTTPEGQVQQTASTEALAAQYEQIRQTQQQILQLLQGQNPDLAALLAPTLAPPLDPATAAPQVPTPGDTNVPTLPDDVFTPPAAPTPTPEFNPFAQPGVANAPQGDVVAPAGPDVELMDGVSTNIQTDPTPRPRPTKKAPTKSAAR
jgi:hypothetical protein